MLIAFAIACCIAAIIFATSKVAAHANKQTAEPATLFQKAIAWGAVLLFVFCSYSFTSPALEMLR